MEPNSTLQAIFSSIEGMKSADLQTTDQVADYLSQLSSWLAYTNEQMAIAGRALNIAKRDAYAKLQEQYNEKGIHLSPSLAKDYIASLCSAQAYNYQMAERCSRTCTHVIDSMRSVLSMKKQELEMMRYQPA